MKHKSVYNLPPEERLKDHRRKRDQYALQPKQKLFAEYMLAGFDVNPCDAAEQAGYEYSMGTTLIKNPAIREYINKRREELTQELIAPIRVDQETVISEMAKIAFANAHDFCDEDADGAWVPKKKKDLSRDHAAAIKKIIFTNDQFDPSRRVLSSIEFYDKKSALDSLMKHLGLFEKDNVQKKPTFNLNEVLEALPIPEDAKDEVRKKLLAGIEAESGMLH